MAYSIQTAVSDGTLEVLDLSIKYMDKSHIYVYVDDVLVDGSAYSYVWLTDTRIQLVPAVANGSTLKIIRKTLSDEMWHEFSKGARFSTESMDDNFEQLLFLAQEYSEGIYVSDFYVDLDMHLTRILNLGDPVDARDAVNLRTLQDYLPNATSLTAITSRVTALESINTSERVNVVDKGASTTNTPAQNKVALQAAIADVDAAGGGYIIVPKGIDYGFKNTDLSTYPNFTGCVNDITINDYGIGDADGSGNKAGAQIRTFFHTAQTTPVGQHDGNGHWIYGAWHPYYSINNTAHLAAPNAPSRTAFDNRRGSVLFNNDGLSTWRFGQGTLAGAGYTDEELSNFTLEHYQTPSDVLANYAPLTIERKTGNWSIGGGTNAPAAQVHVKNVTPGYWTALFESLATTTETRLRNSNGSGDDVALKNVSGDLVLNITSQGDALVVKKTTRNVAIGSNGNYRLDVADTQANGYVANFKNNSATNGSGIIIDSVSAPSTGFQHLLAMASNGTDVQFRLRGDGNGYCDGAWTGGGADYAEYFEWLDGNPDNEDRRGLTVTLVGDKIRPAVAGDTIVGVVSTNPSVVGDAAWNHWTGKYLRDAFGTVCTEPYEIVEWDELVLTREATEAVPAYTQIWEEVSEDGEVIQYSMTYAGRKAEVAEYTRIHHSYPVDAVPAEIDVPSTARRSVTTRPKLNPDYDASAEYIPREQRKEWACIGLMGKLRVHVGQPVDPRWVKMRDVTADVQEYLVR